MDLPGKNRTQNGISRRTEAVLAAIGKELDEDLNKPIPARERRTDEEIEKRRENEELDEALDDTFPASDPPAMTDASIPRQPRKPGGKKDKASD